MQTIFLRHCVCECLLGCESVCIRYHVLMLYTETVVPVSVCLSLIDCFIDAFEYLFDGLID